MSFSIQHRKRTDNQSEILQLARTPLALDRAQPPLERILRIQHRILIDDDQVHTLRDKSATHPDVDRRLLSIAREHPDFDPSLL